MAVGGGIVKPTTGIFRNLEVGDVITEGILYFQFPSNLGEMVRDGVIDDTSWSPTIQFSSADENALFMGMNYYSWGYGMYVALGDIEKDQMGYATNMVYQTEIANGDTEWYTSNSEYYQFSTSPITVTAVNKSHDLYKWVFIHEDKVPLKVYQGDKELASIQIGDNKINHVYLGDKQIF